MSGLAGYGLLWQVTPEQFDFRLSFWVVVAMIALFCLTVALDDDERYCPPDPPAHADATRRPRR